MGGRSHHQPPCPTDSLVVFCIMYRIPKTYRTVSAGHEQYNTVEIESESGELNSKATVD